MATIEEIRSIIIDRTSDLLNIKHPFALVDFPDHENVGDSAIYLGESVLLQHFGVRPNFISAFNYHSNEEMDRVIGDGPILLHGGGNFGDLWNHHNDFRKSILEKYPDRKIVQLPQTIFFENESNANDMARLIEKCKKFTLLVRDERSFQFASKHFQCEVRLCPDAALMIRDLKRSAASYEILLHLRTDKEAKTRHQLEEYSNRSDISIVDWPLDKEAISRSEKFLSYVKSNMFDFRSYAIGEKARRRANFFDIQARQRVDYGARLLSSGRSVVTDRLHGHILCKLLGINHCVLDNNYGKISGFMDAWGTAGDMAIRVSSLAEAMSLLTTGDVKAADPRDLN